MANNKLQRKRKFPEKHTSIKRHPSRVETPKGREYFKKILAFRIAKEIYKREFNLEVARKMLVAGASVKQIKHAQWLREGNA